MFSLCPPCADDLGGGAKTIEPAGSSLMLTGSLTRFVCVFFKGGRGPDGETGRVKGESGDWSLHGPDTEGTQRGIKQTHLEQDQRTPRVIRLQ